MIQSLKLFTLLFLCIIPIKSWAVCAWVGNSGTAAYCTVAEVNDCLNNLTTGATVKAGVVVVNLPSCSVTWATPVSVNMKTGFAAVTSLTVKGNGVGPPKGSANQTVLNNGGFNFTTKTNKKVRLSNIKFTGTGTAGSNNFVFLMGDTKPSLGGGFRIDHISFNGGHAIGIQAGDCYGVIDNNTGGTNGQFSRIDWGTDTLGGGGNLSWAEGADLGGPNAVYFEDNVLVQTDTVKKWMLCDGTNGARVVARHNHLTDYYISGHDASTMDRGILQYEAYDNYFYATAGFQSDVISIRGGTGVIANNDIDTASDSPFYAGPSGIGMQNYRNVGCTESAGQTHYPFPWTSDCGGGGKACMKGNNFCNPINGGNIYSCDVAVDYLCNTDADCGGAVGSCQYIDGGVNGTGYPCRDQIGRGKDDAANAAQTISYPYLFWNNRVRKAGGAWATATPHVDCGTEIQANRDYCDGGSTMPSTCNGVTTPYVHYPYPHPLTKPAPPENLQIN